MKTIVRWKIQDTTITWPRAGHPSKFDKRIRRNLIRKSEKRHMAKWKVVQEYLANTGSSLYVTIIFHIVQCLAYGLSLIEDWPTHRLEPHSWHPKEKSATHCTTNWGPITKANLRKMLNLGWWIERPMCNPVSYQPGTNKELGVGLAKGSRSVNGKGQKE